VLAIDPSSKIGGGSILGDKTRMAELAKHPSAFIRPSPAGDTLGGVARRTRDAIVAVEAAGFDVVIVETVGVGQSETAVADMVDMLILLLLPSGGDELQGLKKGIVELADLLVITKADGALLDAARVAQAEYRSALHLLRAGGSHWRVPVLRCSAVEGTGLDEVWDAVGAWKAAMGGEPGLARRRAEQALAWLWNEVREGLMARLRGDPALARLVPKLEADVRRGRLTPPAAASELLAAFFDRPVR
jgi:LAO/AO transport system kinase